MSSLNGVKKRKIAFLFDDKKSIQSPHGSKHNVLFSLEVNWSHDTINLHVNIWIHLQTTTQERQNPSAVFKRFPTWSRYNDQFFIAILRFGVILGGMETHLLTHNNWIASPKVELARVKRREKKDSGVDIQCATWLRQPGRLRSGQVTMQFRAWTRPLQWHKPLACDVWFQCNAALRNEREREREKHVFATRVTRWKHVFLPHFTKIFHWRFKNIIVILGVLGSGTPVVDGPNYDAKKEKKNWNIFLPLHFFFSLNVIKISCRAEKSVFHWWAAKRKQGHSCWSCFHFSSWPQEGVGTGIGKLRPEGHLWPIMIWFAKLEDIEKACICVSSILVLRDIWTKN